MHSKTRKTAILSAGALALLLAGPAIAADVPLKAPVVKAATPPTPAWDVAFGGAVMTDYIFRGISQSNRSWSANAYAELQVNGSWGQIYGAVSGSSIEWPNALFFTDPAAEIDFYGGWRPNKIGKLALDLGYIYYYYPKETPVGNWSGNGFITNSDFWEIYLKAAYEVNDKLTIGSSIWYSPSVLNYGSDGIYVNATFKWVLPELSRSGLGWYVSGELAHWWLGSTDFPYTSFYTGATYDIPDYTHWNLGLAFTYKALTLDVRYHGTDLSRRECESFLIQNPGNAAGKWCGDAVVAKLSFDTALSQLK